jgi:hypothetical protein
MTKYYGVIVDLIDRSTDSIEAEDKYKPGIESAGMFCSCHWFKDEAKALIFEIGCLKTFRNMKAQGMKGLI